MRLFLFSVLFGAVVLVLILYFIHDSGTTIPLLKVNETCLRGNLTGICKINGSCITNLTNGALEPCNEDDYTLICCPAENFLEISGRMENQIAALEVTTITNKHPKRVPGEKAKEMCKVYGKTAYRKTMSPNLLNPISVEEVICEVHEPLVKGGKDAKEKEFPHMAMLGNFVSTGLGGVDWLCGGSIVSPKFILSAAHCNISKEYGYAMVGAIRLENTGEFFADHLISISAVIIHPDYKHGSNNNDIALFKLSNSLSISERPICLDTGSSILNSMMVIATGFGLNEEQVAKDVLQKVSLNIVDEASCIGKYKQFQRIKVVPENNICAYAEGKDTCSGDSGGPLQVRHSELECMYTLIGVTSFGVNCTLDTNLPGVYTKVSSYVGWIEDIVWPAED